MLFIIIAGCFVATCLNYNEYLLGWGFVCTYLLGSERGFVATCLNYNEYLFGWELVCIYLLGSNIVVFVIY